MHGSGCMHTLAASDGGSRACWQLLGAPAPRPPGWTGRARSRPLPRCLRGLEHLCGGEGGGGSLGRWHRTCWRVGELLGPRPWPQRRRARTQFNLNSMLRAQCARRCAQCAREEGGPTHPGRRTPAGRRTRRRPSLWMCGGREQQEEMVGWLAGRLPLASWHKLRQRALHARQHLR